MSYYSLWLVITCLIFLLSFVFLIFRYYIKKEYVSKDVYDILQDQLEKTEKILELRDAECVDLNRLLAKQDQVCLSLKEKLINLESSEKEKSELYDKSFEKIANKLFINHGEKFQQKNTELLQLVLSPLKERINHFEKKIELLHLEDNKERYSLKEQIKELTNLNQQMNQDTINLTNALKGNVKVQGNWGEMILENILVQSGLRKEHDYFTQKCFTKENGEKLIPDFIINLPGDKHIVIDSKMSLTAYERYCSAEDELEHTKALSDHLKSINSHIKNLNSKNYQNLYQLNSLDFVIMFIPVEAAFNLVLEKKYELFNDAFNKNVLIASPLSLLAVTRTISQIWYQEKRNKNAYDIAIEAGRLYDKFVNFTTDLEQVGSKIRQAEDAYNGAFKKLKYGNGNIIQKIRKISELGARNSKELPKEF